MIIDASGSADTTFNAVDRLNTKLDGFLADRGCGELAFVPLNSLSDTSACQQPRLDLDPPVGDPDAARQAMRSKALQQALQLLECARLEPNDSDVLGALRKAGSTRPPGDETYAVLVVSDMIQTDDQLNLLRSNLETPEVRAEAIAGIGTLTPALPNTVLYPTDLGTNIEDGQRGQQLRAFWTELLATEAAGHATIDMTYA